MDNAWQDIRYGVRGLLKSPGFTTVVVLTLALGIGANTAIFTVVNSVVLQPLPFDEPDRLVSLCETSERVGDYCVASQLNVLDWSRRSRTFESIGLGRHRSFLLEDGGVSEGIVGGLASPSLFNVFRVTPHLGRLFTANEVGEGRHYVVLLTYALWQSRFGGDRAVVGRELTLDGESYEVVGVLPPDVEIPHLDFAQLWTPLPFDLTDEENRAWRGFLATGRLQKDVELEVARAEMETIAGALAQEYPESNEEWGLSLVPLHDQIVGSVRSSLLVFLIAVGLVLLIGCVNVANLMLVRSSQRQKEFAIRLAIGAGRSRMLRQILTESVLIACLAGAVGLLVGTWTVDVFLSLAPGNIPRLDEVSVDAAVLTFAVVVTALTSIVFGLIPALRSARVDLNHSLKEGHQSESSRSRVGFRGLLIISEVALALVLLIGAGLLTRSFASILGWQPGFDRENLLTVSTYASTGKYSEGDDVNRLFERAAEEIGSVPSVVSVGATSAGPLFGGRETGGFRVEGRGDPSSGDHLPARWYDVDPGYFDALGVSLLAGRHFTGDDDADAPRVAIINETMARRFWGEENPIGQRVTWVDAGWVDADLTFEVVGVVRDVEPFLPGTPTDPEIFWPKGQFPRWATFFVIRTESDPTSIIDPIRDRLKALDPDLSVRRFATMGELVDGGLIRPRFNMLLLGTFAAVALLLATVGTYGVLSHSVSQKTREIGLRMSLGARRVDIIRWVLWRGLKLTMAGVILGVAGASLVTQGLSSMLYGVSTTDMSTFAAVSALLIVVAILACYVPARRASRVDPIVALRQE
jgi:putative ABC transport system permease protein